MFQRKSFWWMSFCKQESTHGFHLKVLSKIFFHKICRIMQNNLSCQISNVPSFGQPVNKHIWEVSVNISKTNWSVFSDWFFWIVNVWENKKCLLFPLDNWIVFTKTIYKRLHKNKNKNLNIGIDFVWVFLMWSFWNEEEITERKNHLISMKIFNYIVKVIFDIPLSK